MNIVEKDFLHILKNYGHDVLVVHAEKKERCEYFFPGGRSCYNSVTGSADRSCPICYGLGYIPKVRKYRTRERALSINERRPTSQGSLSFGELAIENNVYYFYKDVPIREQDIII